MMTENQDEELPERQTFLQNVERAMRERLRRADDVKNTIESWSRIEIPPDQELRAARAVVASLRSDASPHYRDDFFIWSILSLDYLEHQHFEKTKPIRDYLASLKRKLSDIQGDISELQYLKEHPGTRFSPFEGEDVPNVSVSGPVPKEKCLICGLPKSLRVHVACSNV